MSKYNHYWELLTPTSFLESSTFRFRIMCADWIMGYHWEIVYRNGRNERNHFSSLFHKAGSRSLRLKGKHFLGNCPPTPPLSQHQYLLLTSYFFNQLSYTELIIKLMNSQNFSVNSHLLKFVSFCDDLRNNLLSNHADDTWLTIVIIALHYHCYDLFVCFLQYCNYIIIVMQIKLMLLLLLLLLLT